MNKLVRVCLAGLVALLATLGFASAAQAYPEVTIDASVSAEVVAAGQTFTAKSSANVECSWTQSWNGTTQRSTGSAMTSKFRAPEVQTRTVIPVHFTCTYDVSGSANRTATWERSINVTVVPRAQVLAPTTVGGAAPAAAPAGAPAVDAADGGASMPNTGGPNVLFLVAGVLLLLSGAVAVKMARGRADEPETAPTKS